MLKQKKKQEKIRKEVGNERIPEWRVWEQNFILASCEHSDAENSP